MDSAHIIEEMQPIFRDVLDQPGLILTSESSASNVEDWDSLAQVNLIVSLEKRYKVEFTLDELQELANVGDMAELIQKKVQS